MTDDYDLKNNLHDKEEIGRKLKIVNTLRPILITFLLGSTLFFSILEDLGSLSYIFVFIILASFVFSYFYTILPRTLKNIESLAYTELIFDLLLETFVIFCTGGTESPFQLCYALTVITAATLLYKNGAYIISTMASILYISLTSLQLYEIILPFPNILFPGNATNVYLVIFKVFSNIVAFYIIAYLTSYLALSFRENKSELIKKQEDLSRLQAFNNNILENMSSGLIVTDLTMKIILANQGAAAITGFSPARFRGRNFNDFFLNLPVMEVLPKIIGEHRGAYRWEGNVSRNDGKAIYLGMSISPLKNDKLESIGTISTFQDLTKLKQMEDEVKRSEKVAAIGELAAGMAHEIRNPLASIRGSVQMLRDELDLNEADKKLMSIVLEESDRLNKIITDFLLFARPKPLNKSTSNLQKSIADTVSLLKASHQQNKKITINTYLENIPYFLFDDDQIRQVLWNLILNAVQSMPGGGIIDIRARVIENPSPELEMIGSEKVTYPLVILSVQDGGEGISESNMAKLFVPFYTTKECGSGLGLSIVHRIIENHGGQLSVDSEADNGTTFTVYLPFKMS